MTAKDVYKGRQLSLIFPNTGTLQQFKDWAGDRSLSKYIIDTVIEFHEQQLKKQQPLKIVRELAILQEENEKLREERRILKLALSKVEAENAKLRTAPRSSPVFEINKKLLDYIFAKSTTKPLTVEFLNKELKELSGIDKKDIYRQLTMLQDMELIQETPEGWRRKK